MGECVDLVCILVIMSVVVVYVVFNFSSSLLMIIENRASKGCGKILHSQTREVIFNLYTFMKRKAAEGPILLKQEQKGVAEATGVSRSSVQRVLIESRKQQKQPQVAEQPFPNTFPSLSQLLQPPKSNGKKYLKKDKDDFDKDVVSRTIYDFHRREGQPPTLQTLLPVLKDYYY